MVVLSLVTHYQLNLVYHEISVCTWEHTGEQLVCSKTTPLLLAINCMFVHFW